VIVVDASAILSWLLSEERSKEFDAAINRIAEQGAYAPGNFPSEVVHGLLQAHRRGRIDRSYASTALTELAALPIAVELPDPHDVMAIAEQHQLTGYDAAYLALALERQIPLVTADMALRKAAAAAKVQFRATKSRK
jgi:predicted nucleic acid-binding protein